MREILVSEGQSLLDVSLWLLGGTEALYILADANGLAITDDLTAGQVLKVPDDLAVNPDLVAFLKAKNVAVNTANVAPPAASEPEGLHDFLDADFSFEDFF